MWHTLELGALTKRLKSNIKYGLSEDEAKLRLEKNGKNKIAEQKKDFFLFKFFRQFNDVMIIILIVSSIISAVLTKVEGSNDYLDSIIIIGIVLLNAIMGAVQELRAEKSIEALKKMSAPVAKVKRGGNIYNIPSEDLVVGDIILLESRKFCTSGL